MADPILFIGVVSHAGSSYAGSQGESGLAAQIAAALPDTVVHVNTRDLWTESGQSPPDDAGLDSLNAEIQFEGTWRRYLGLPPSAQEQLRILSRRLALFRHRRRGTLPNVERLLNIELSHVDLLRRGLESGAPYLLILEDDAECLDIKDLAAGISAIVIGSARPDLVNLSHSFSIAELGVGSLLAPHESVAWGGTRPRSILRTRKLITNTVCALLYSKSFAETIHSGLTRLPTFPVLPIDWKVNKVISQLPVTSSTDACWWIDPAPVTQRSMHSLDSSSRPAILDA